MNRPQHLGFTAVKIALKASLYSWLIYKHPSVLRDYCKTHGKQVVFHDFGPLEVAVVTTLGSEMVVFRGSDKSAVDWCVNASALGPPFGVWHPALYLEVKQIAKRLDEDAHPDRKRVFCGHSKGGGEALIYAHLSRYPAEQVHTFGAMAVCRDPGLPNTPHYRWVNNGDKVPRLLSLRALGYKHSGTLCYFDRKQRLRFGNHVRTRKDIFAAVLEDTGRPGFLGAKRHSIEEYHLLLRQLYGNQNHQGHA